MRYRWISATSDTVHVVQLNVRDLWQLKRIQGFMMPRWLSNLGEDKKRETLEHVLQLLDKKVIQPLTGTYNPQPAWAMARIRD